MFPPPYGFALEHNRVGLRVNRLKMSPAKVKSSISSCHVSTGYWLVTGVSFPLMKGSKVTDRSRSGQNVFSRLIPE